MIKDAESKNIRKKLIVLVEDEEIMVSLLVRFLTNAGYEVRVARDGQSGLELIKKVGPDLVLLDILLPRLNGFQVLEKLVRDKLLPDLPVIIVSNSGQPVEIERALKFGIKDYLIKVNFDPRELLTKIERVFAGMGGDQLREKEIFGATALLVEDDTFLVELLEKAFSKKGYKVLTALDVERARKMLAGSKIDLILLDIVLPGIDGFTFLKELKADSRWKDIPVMIVSNLGQKEEVEKGLALGADGYVIKAHATTDEIFKRAQEIITKKGRGHN